MVRILRWNILGVFFAGSFCLAQTVIPPDRAGLEKGEGMGMALYGEINGYPGPKHVLEFKDELGLTKEQMKKTESLINDVNSSATVKGQEVIEAEEDLNESFVTGKVTERALRAKLEKIGKLRGELRFVHLQAHLKMKQILSANQITRYNELRGHEAH
ncbi:MAG: hypothetical protein WBD36_03310 [Bacteroidota bacterium]